mmetsp:Transcript_53881/g.117577  ORF Transcript_53881/g.117577 Transcript_53881/m.117577 type:complete len:306 (+) Transcript_53881:476-1393(+)
MLRPLRVHDGEAPLGAPEDDGVSEFPSAGHEPEADLPPAALRLREAPHGLVQAPLQPRLERRGHQGRPPRVRGAAAPEHLHQQPDGPPGGVPGQRVPGARAEEADVGRRRPRRPGDPGAAARRRLGPRAACGACPSHPENEHQRWREHGSGSATPDAANASGTAGLRLAAYALCREPGGAAPAAGQDGGSYHAANCAVLLSSTAVPYCPRNVGWTAGGRDHGLGSRRGGLDPARRRRPRLGRGAGPRPGDRQAAVREVRPVRQVDAAQRFARGAAACGEQGGGMAEQGPGNHHPRLPRHPTADGA